VKKKNKVLELYRVTSSPERVAARREIAGPIEQVIVMPAYHNVVKADSPGAAARTGFDHAEEIGRPQTELHVNLLRQPDAGGPGLCYETTREWTFLQIRGRVIQRPGVGTEAKVNGRSGSISVNAVIK